MTDVEHYDNWSQKEIVDPGPNDVMCGRGGGTNNHVGNIRFRQLVNEHKLRYLAAPKVDKPKVARDVVQIWRAQSPPGRFLTKSSAGTASKSKEALWHDVGDQKAREKASQCLRERTPDVLPFMQHLKSQEQVSVASKDKSDKRKKHPDRVSSQSGNGTPAVPYTVKSQTESGVDAHFQQLQQLHELQQQQIQQLQLIQQQLAAGIDPNVVLAAQDVTSMSRNPVKVDPGRRLSLPLDRNEDVDALLDEDASATAIATALFGRQPSNDLSGQDISVKREPKVNERLHNSAMTLEEYTKDSNGGMAMDDRSAKMDDISKGSWVQSFQSIDSASMTSEHSLGKIGVDENSKDLYGRQTKMCHAKSMKDSKMSMISELTDYDNAARKSNRTLTSRSRKMQAAKTLNSNISMLSELTDMTGDFSTLSLKK